MNSNNRAVSFRRYCSDDYEAFSALMSDAEVTRHTDGPMQADAVRTLFARFSADDGDDTIDAWAVLDKDSCKYIGHAALKLLSDDGAELIVVLAKAVWRKGYGYEVAAMLLDHAFFTRGLTLIIATVDADHAAGIRIAEKNGMRLDHWEEDEEGRYPVYSINSDAWQHHLLLDQGSRTPDNQLREGDCT